MSVGNVFTWPTPQQGGGDFTSRAAQLWYDWGESGRDDEQQWYNQFQSFANQSVWQNAISEQYFDDSLYSFTTNPFDPYKAVTGFTPRSNFAYARIMGDIGAWIEREHPELSWFGQNGATIGSGSMANIGGEWAGVDKWNNEILAAQSKVQQETGVWVPGNVIKAIMKIESNGEWLPTNDAGAVGLMQVTPMSMGSERYDFSKVGSDPAYNIWAGVTELALRYQDAMRQNPNFTWANVAVGYFSGHYVPTGAADYFGTSDQLYMDIFSRHLATLDGAVQGNYGGGTGGTVGGILAEAQKYLGVQYELGAIPGRGDDPWQTGWDCSGFTYWLDQNFGAGRLPQGSHYQYQYAVDTGQLFTNKAQLAPGDLVFINTGWMGGAGSHLNAAGHVGIYLGDGKIINAVNEAQGTTISNLDGLGVFLGGMKMSWSGAGGTTATGVSTFLAITGGIPFPVSQEFGPTEWSQGEGSWMYDDYDYTLGVDGHPGLDVGTPMYTKLYAPADGIVTIDGGTGYYALEGSEYQPYTGQLQVRMANGDEYILGHMYQIDVRVGQTIRAGDLVGLSGTYNGPHVHIEYWANKPHQYGRFTAIDPRIAFGGQYTGQLGQPGAGDPVFRAGADNWAAFMRATATGQPVTGYSSGTSGGSFHNWMKQGLLNGWQSPSGTGGTTGAWQPGQNTVAGAWGASFSPQVWSNIQNLSNAARS